MNRKVKYARLQTEAYLPGTGSLGTTFPPNSKTLKDLHMETDEDGLFIQFEYLGVVREILVPYPNVVLVELSPVSKKH